MRRFFRFLSLGFMVFLCSPQLWAQGMKDPCTWTYEAKKIAANEYQLSFKLEMGDGWHIWSIHAGGDGTLIAPSFSFEAHKAAQMIGSIKEEGKLINSAIEGVEGKVNYYNNTVIYTQVVKAKAGSIVKGTHQYQVCNDMMCLPPRDRNFSFTLP
ncbi:MAG: protein-disulfide reductase DsbD family protein [Phycisphaerales bacterium]|nr:protein-disulfide reductase DsbD family protein [Phycisphaerales bacterium]